jgi:peptide/nickel transport system substrate-binding protein
LTAGVLAIVIAIGVVLAAGTANAQRSALPRNATLYTSGSAWGPFTSFNPLRNGYSTGTLGLLYETMFRYDPLKDAYKPWLATNGAWVGKTYVATVRSGVKWNDGQPLTAADIKFSFETGKLDGSEFATMWKTGLSKITTKGNKVSFVFTGRPNYLDWETVIYTLPIVPQHIWKDYSATEITTGNTDDTSKMVGTGPFVYGAGKGTSGTLQWTRRDGWWATKAFGMKMPMQYFVDIHNSSNSASLPSFLAANIDLSNNFFPGVDKFLGKGGIESYYPAAPYMQSANTAWLMPNTTHKPLNDVKFRRALAMSIDINKIVTNDYGNIVAKANPTGLLPTWSKWIDKAQANKLGFKYDVAGAKALLAANGYKTGSDGYVLNKDGSPINLKLIVPNGWSDWMTAIQLIAASAKDAGIHITPAYPDYNGLVAQRSAGTYDLLIANDKQLGPTPYTYYDYVFHLPIADQQTFANYARFTQAGAKPWALTLNLNKVNPANITLQKKYHSMIQKYILTDLPAIPLWYNGMWSQYNTKYWTNFPKSTGSGLQNTTVVWNGYLNMTTIDALAKLKPVG